jgi:NAD(P)-dependent dehydrogenase (short-subunit alcohol dehydrogenase family)
LAQKLPGSLPGSADMTQFDRVREAIGSVHRHYVCIDGVVNSAGRSYAASVEEIDPALFDEICHLNVHKRLAESERVAGDAPVAP